MRHWTPAVLLLFLAAACGDPPPPPDEPEVPAAPGVGEVVAAVTAARGELHGDRREAPYPVSAELEAALADHELEALLHAFFRTAGECALVCNGDITPAAAALLERIPELRTHGIDPAGYEFESLSAEVKAYRQATGAPTPEGDVERVVVDALRAPVLSKAELTANLNGAGEPPAKARIDALVAASKAAAVHPEATGPRVTPLRIQLARALLTLMLDFKFQHKAGPTEFTTSIPKLTHIHRDEMVAMMTAATRSPAPMDAFKKLEPKVASYRELVGAHKRYLDLVDKGGCPQLPSAWKFVKGVKSGPEVKKLQERLACEGWYEGPTNGNYDTQTKDAVKKYQSHHEYEPDGWVTEGVLRSLNVPIKRRAEQIALTLQRKRETRLDGMGDFFIRVNIPAFEIQVIENGEVIKRQRAIVGANKLDDDKVSLIQGHINRTHLFTTNLYKIDINPDWTLPERMAKGEVVGSIAKNPKYLEQNRMRKTTLANGKQVYVQAPGEGNLLGKVKFLLEESNAIFLHDTNDRWLFRNQRRDFSHGCIRVDEAPEFAKWILVRDGWDPADIDRSLDAEKTQRGITLHAPIPLITVYETVEIGDGSLPIFLSDVYDYDEAYEKGQLPVEETIRWGHTRLRPRWVPKVDEATVEGWRRAGKTAPRDLKPK